MSFFASLAAFASAAVLATTAATAAPAATVHQDAAPAAFSGVKALPSLTHGKQLAAGTYQVTGFTKGPYGAVFAGTVRGQGMDKTFIRLKPKSMKQKAPTDQHATGVSSPTNPYYILESHAKSSISDLTIEGTDQGYLSKGNKAKCYNGLRFNRGAAVNVRNVHVLGVPGWSNQNPGETFAIGTNHANNPHFTNVVIDGENHGGTGIGLNNAAGGTFDNVRAYGMKYGHGVALWQITGKVTFNNFRVENSHSALSIERVQGTVVLNNPSFTDNKGNDINIGNDKGHTKLVLNYKVAPKHKVHIVGLGGKEQGNKNRVTKADIHLYVNGVDKTSKYVKF